MRPRHRVLLVDDHPVVLSGLRLLLENAEAYDVCGEARSVREAFSLAEQLTPELLVVDLVLGGRDGIEFIEDLLATSPSARILVFSSMDESIYAPRVLRAGARGYVMKARGLHELAHALDEVANGRFAFGAAAQQQLFARMASRNESAIDSLSDRELQIFRLLGGGKTTATIASELCLSLKTIGTYRERLKHKLCLRDALALEQNARDFVQRGAIT